MGRLRIGWLIPSLLLSVIAVGASVAWAGPEQGSCAGSMTIANQRTSSSEDGTVIRGSSCPDLIFVTSARVRKVIGGDGDDVIYVNPEVEVVIGGPGDDVIYGDLPDLDNLPSGVTLLDGEGATASLTEKFCKAGVSCYGGIGSQELIGSSGNDKIFGQRGNDTLKGESGDDQLFGGIGDEELISGGGGDDLLSGGLGADHLNGNQDSDLVRGDGTIDTIEDTGAEGTDTLSFATGVTPGFEGGIEVSGFPADSASEERGVNLDLSGENACGEFPACNNEARFGGGKDDIVVSGFENVIGTPFADYIYGSDDANRIDGGGGADVIRGGGGDDVIYGGADGDYLRGDGGNDTVYGQGGTNNCHEDVESQNQCSGSSVEVDQRDRSKISVGYMATSVSTDYVELYLTGSTAADRVTASFGFEESGTGWVNFATEGESAQFDTSGDAASENCTYATTTVKCLLPKPLDAIVMAGMAGNDRLALSITESYWETTTPILLGGEGADELIGAGYTEDLLVDGNGEYSDVLQALGSDDGLLNNKGADTLEGGNGNDLLVTSGTCQGDTLQGAASGAGDGSAQNNASFAQLPAGGGGVVADLESEGAYKGTAGDSYLGGPACSSGSVALLRNIDDLEGSKNADALFGDGFSNNLLGGRGTDALWARGGGDNIEAADTEKDEGGGGAGTDTCSLDGIDSFASCNP